MKKLISYIFPIYNETDNISILYEEMLSVVKQASEYEYELIFINDGSTDDSLDKLNDIQKSNKRITVINFARNFGHQLAVTAGLDISKGDAVIIMDSDMQDPPKVCLQLIEQWKNGYDVVYAQRRTRKDTLPKKLSAYVYYSILHRMADINIPRNTGDFRLIDRRVVDVLNQFREHNRFLRGLVSYVGFKQVAVLFDREARNAGETGYPLKRMMKFASDGIFGFSSAPLKLINSVGYFVSGLSFLGIVYAICIKLFDPSTVVPGWTFIVITILFIGGIQTIMIGVVGNYVGRIYTESQNRPLYIIESIRSTSKSNQD